MSHFKNILVPTDFSAPALEGIRCAARMAAEGGRLHLLHVVAPMVPDAFFETRPITAYPTAVDSRRIARSKLEDLRRAELAEIENVEVLVREGHAPTEIVRAADELATDLIVIGATGHSALATVLLGSTAERVARDTTRPVLLVKRKPRRYPEA